MKTIYKCNFHAVEVYVPGEPPKVLPCPICGSGAALQQTDEEPAPLYIVGKQYKGYVFTPYVQPDVNAYPLVLQKKQRSSANKFEKGERFKEVEWNGTSLMRQYEHTTGARLITTPDVFEQTKFPPMPGGAGDTFDIIEGIASNTLETQPIDVSRELSTKFARTRKGSTLKEVTPPERDEDDLPF